MKTTVSEDLGNGGSQIMIGNRYRVHKKLGKGSYGIIYQGVDIRTNEQVAIKLERKRSDEPLLQYEANLYEKLQDLEGVSQMHWFGVQDDFNVMILDLQGPSLEELFSFC